MVSERKSKGAPCTTNSMGIRLLACLPVDGSIRTSTNKTNTSYNNNNKKREYLLHTIRTCFTLKCLSHIFRAVRCVFSPPFSKNTGKMLCVCVGVVYFHFFAHVWFVYVCVLWCDSYEFRASDVHFPIYFASFRRLSLYAPSPFLPSLSQYGISASVRYAYLLDPLSRITLSQFSRFFTVICLPIDKNC